MYYIYVLQCSDGSLYTGITNDIRKRLADHYYQRKAAAKYTKSHHVEEIVGLWTVENKGQALKVEAYIKSLSKAEKVKAIASPNDCFEGTILSEMAIKPKAEKGFSLKKIIGEED